MSKGVCSTCKHFPGDEHCNGCRYDLATDRNTRWEPSEEFNNKHCASEQACREDKKKVLQKIKSELWMEGMNMTGEYQGIWVRFRDIERIIDKYMAESEVVNDTDK